VMDVFGAEVSRAPNHDVVARVHPFQSGPRPDAELTSHICWNRGPTLS